jgi:hypothetical protein
LSERRCNPGRAEQVDFYRCVEGCIEADRGGRVHDRRTGRQKFPACVVKAEPVHGDVAGDREDAPRCLGVKAFAELAAKSLEAVIAQDISFNPVPGPAPAGPDKQDHLCVG